MLILKQSEVEQILAGRETQIIALVRQAYLTHARGESSLPHSLFLRFPQDPGDRIIALPVYLQGEEPRAGVKWVASFPRNHERGLPRASAVIVLNSAETGFPMAILEGSMISARRTAASAALAVDLLSSAFDAIGIVGAGVIAFETLRFIAVSRSNLRQTAIKVFDVDRRRASQFAERCDTAFESASVRLARNLEEALECPVVVLATSTAAPYVPPATRFLPGTTVIHLSLRDLPPELLVRHVNIVDDLDHVVREQTSVHLARLMTGNTDFVRGTIAEVASSKLKPRVVPSDTVIFSPFGLGILDLALSRMIVEEATRLRLGFEMPDFFSAPSI